MTRRDRLDVGKARARLHEAIRQLDLALERADNDDWESGYRIALAASQAFEGSRTCRLTAERMDRPDSFEGAEAHRPEDLPLPPNADTRFDEMDGG